MEETENVRPWPPYLCCWDLGHLQYFLHGQVTLLWGWWTNAICFICLFYEKYIQERLLTNKFKWVSELIISPIRLQFKSLPFLKERLNWVKQILTFPPKITAHSLTPGCPQSRESNLNVLPVKLSDVETETRQIFHPSKENLAVGPHKWKSILHQHSNLLYTWNLSMKNTVMNEHQPQI